MPTSCSRDLSPSALPSDQNTRTLPRWHFYAERVRRAGAGFNLHQWTEAERSFLKDIADGSLHFAWRGGAHNFAETRTRYVAVDRGRTVELRVVEGVEGLQPQLDGARFAERHAFVQRDVVAAVPNGPSGGSAKASELNTGAPLRGSVLSRSAAPVVEGVSTPSLLMPFGIVPNSDVSLLL